MYSSRVFLGVGPHKKGDIIWGCVCLGVLDVLGTVSEVSEGQQFLVITWVSFCDGLQGTWCKPRIKGFKGRKTVVTDVIDKVCVLRCPQTDRVVSTGSLEGGSHRPSCPEGASHLPG